MKKIFFLLFTVIAVNAQSQTAQRIVLVEEFTNASCSPCALSNPAFETLMNANTTKVIPIKYHTSFPGYDPFYSANSTQNQARSVYYSITGVPNARMDGVGTFLQDVNQTSINAQYAVPSTFTVTLSWKYSTDGDSIYVTAAFKTLQTITASLTGHIVIIEKAVNFTTAPGTNGELNFTNVMRKMLPSQTGTILPATFYANQIITVTTGMPVTTGFADISKIGVIGFVQNNTTKAVLQAAYAPNPTTVPTNPTIILVSKINPVCTNNGSIDISVIGASGTYTYNWGGGITTQDRTNLAIGTYSVTVTSGIKTATTTFTLTQGALSAPTSVITNGITSCSAKLNWAAKSGASYYQVKYKPSSSSTWSAPISVTTLNYNFIGLLPSTQYNFSTAAVCANGTVGTVTTYSATTSSCTLPTSTSSASVTATSATITWSAGCNSTSYEIQYMIQGSTSWSIATSTTTSKVLTALTPSKIYQYKVRTLCGVTYTAFSAVKTFVTPAQRLESTTDTDMTMELYPNPFESKLYLKQPANLIFSENASVVVFDILGRNVAEFHHLLFNNGICEIDFPSEITPGVYIIELKSGDYNTQQPVIKL